MVVRVIHLSSFTMSAAGSLVSLTSPATEDVRCLVCQRHSGLLQFRVWLLFLTGARVKLCSCARLQWNNEITFSVCFFQVEWNQRRWPISNPIKHEPLRANRKNRRDFSSPTVRHKTCIFCAHMFFQCSHFQFLIFTVIPIYYCLLLARKLKETIIFMIITSESQSD